MIRVGGLTHGQAARRKVQPRAVKEQGDLLGEDHLVVFQRQKIVRTPIQNGLGDFGLGAHRVNRDQCPSQLQAFKKNQGNRTDLIRFSVRRLLPQNQSLSARPSGNHMQRVARAAARAA